MLVDQRFADVHFPQANAVGQRIQLAAARGTVPASWLTIVGIVPTIRQWSIDEGEPIVYQPARRSRLMCGARHSCGARRSRRARHPQYGRPFAASMPNLPLYRSARRQALKDSNWNGRVAPTSSLRSPRFAHARARGRFVVTAQSLARRTQQTAFGMPWAPIGCGFFGSFSGGCCGN